MMLPAKIRHRIRIDHTQDRIPGNCWIWQGCDNGKGYGQTTYAGRRGLTHRLSYELLVGPIAQGLQIDHLCRVPRCCNPAHLEPVTNLENSLRSDRATRTHCIRGHALAGDNLIVKSPGGRGRRACRTCNRMKVAEARERQRQRRFAAYLAERQRIRHILRERAS